MDIRNFRQFKKEAADALAVGRDPKKVILVYAGVLTLVMLFVSLADAYLAHQISDTGGLANLGIRSILSTIQMVLPLAQSFFLLCWDYGYASAVLRLGRKQYADHTDLLAGFHRFGPVFRCELLQSIMYIIIMLVCSHIGFFIFILTPLGESTRSLILSMATVDAAQMEAMMMDPEFVLQLSDSVMPAVPITMVLFAALALPFSYLYRMAKFALMDQPQKGAFAALRASRVMLRGHKIGLFKLDLSFWWYYGLILLATVISYGDDILSLVGITLPFSETVSYLIFYSLYLVIQFTVYYFFRNQVDATFVRVYDTLRPKDQDNGVILGNIFNL